MPQLFAEASGPGVKPLLPVGSEDECLVSLVCVIKADECEEMGS